VDTGKLDMEGFLSPRVLEAFSQYMNFNRELADGSLRDSDNWQKGIPLNVYMKSAWRHFFDWWKEHRGCATKEGLVWALCGLLFNLQGYLNELLKDDPALADRALRDAEDRRYIQRLKAARAQAKVTPSNPYFTMTDRNGCTIEAQYGNKDPEADVPDAHKFLTPYPKAGRFS
jgi:hypothetical protein